MANTPVFDANDYASESILESDRRNMVVTDQYEPGSTFKMVTVAAALEAGLVTPRDASSSWVGTSRSTTWPPRGA